MCSCGCRETISLSRFYLLTHGALSSQPYTTAALAARWPCRLLSQHLRKHALTPGLALPHQVLLRHCLHSPHCNCGQVLTVAPLLLQGQRSFPFSWLILPARAKLLRHLVLKQQHVLSQKRRGTALKVFGTAVQFTVFINGNILDFMQRLSL